MDKGAQWQRQNELWKEISLRRALELPTENKFIFYQAVGL